MRYVNFSEKEMADNFQTICDCFYEKNFGQMSKSDFEALMFHFYIEKLVKDNSDSNGIIDFNACSDYRISNELGITQQRVRNLKVKNQLLFPRDFAWQNAFAKLVGNARVDQLTHRVTVDIPDPNLYIEIQNYLEENGGYIEKQLNSRLLQMRIEYFVELLLSFEDDKTQKAIIKELKKQYKKDNKTDRAFDEKHIAKSLIDGAVNFTEIAVNISAIANPTSVIMTGLLSLLAKF